MNWIENKIKSVDTKDAQIKYSEWLTMQKQKAEEKSRFSKWLITDRTIRGTEEFKAIQKELNTKEIITNLKAPMLQRKYWLIKVQLQFNEGGF